jgi:16S rRNA (guanine1516-N2)-methyltransferase
MAAESAPSDDVRWRLVHTGERLELRSPEDLGWGPFAVDFTSIDLRTGSGNLSRRQPLARAVGRRVSTVVDATAGFGHDAVLLALMGYHVLAVERSPVIADLLEDGVRRARAHAELGPRLGDRLEVRCAEARDVLPECAADAVYLDPMFPPKRRASALPPLAMQIMRAVVGDGPDREDLLAVARHTARRVILKRPTHAPLLAPDVALTMKGKLVRYDVYLSDRTKANESAI